MKRAGVSFLPTGIDLMPLCMHIINTAIRPHGTRVKHFNPDADPMSSSFSLFHRLIVAQYEGHDKVNNPPSNRLPYEGPKMPCRLAITVRPINQRG